MAVPIGGGKCWMKTGSPSPAIAAKYAYSSPVPAFLTYGGMAMTASAPDARACRASSTACRVVTPLTPATTGLRPLTVSTHDLDDPLPLRRRTERAPRWR